MTTEQLEQRLQNIESKVSQIVGRLDSADGHNPKSKWWEKIPPLSEEVQEAWDEMQPYLLKIVKRNRVVMKREP